MSKIYYGAALYPELWDEQTVSEDIKHMKKIGMNLARIGEFAWSTFEPEQDQFDFSVLTNTIEQLAKNEIDVIVCTPTPTPPIWLTDQHEERLHRNQDQTLMHHGSRQHVCTNHEFFRERAALITQKIAEVVAEYNNVKAIQLDNEFKCHIGPCYCLNCKRLWHEWLEAKYPSIEKLNQAWGTSIWSQTYLSFDQVVQPLTTPFLHNSALIRNYNQFTFDKLKEFAREQATIIRNITDIPVTHNSSMFFDLDNEDLAAELDFISFDTYTPASNYPGFMMNNERWRYLKNDTRKFMLLETSTSYNGHLNQYGKLHERGYVVAESFATYAAGAEAFMYWLFRGQKSGCEQPHGSVVSSWGDPTIGYQNVQDVARTVKEITPLLQSSRPIEPEVALTYSDQARSFIKGEPGNDYDYKTMVTDFYKHFLDLGIARKLVPEGHDLQQCQVLFTPYVHYISDDYLNRLITFVENGGTWIAGPMTGDRTENHTWHTSNGLGKLGELAGVDQIIQFPATGTDHYGEAFGTEAELSLLSTFFDVKDGTVTKGTVTKGQARGKSFIAEKQLGKGKLVLFGSMPTGEAGQTVIKSLITYYTNGHHVTDHLVIEEGLVIIPRQSDKGKKQQWLVNFTNEVKSFTVEKELIDRLNGQAVNPGKYLVDPFGYRVLEEK